MTRQETITRIISVHTNHRQMWRYPKPLEQRDERQSLEFEVSSQYNGSFLCSSFLLEREAMSGLQECHSDRIRACSLGSLIEMI